MIFLNVKRERSIPQFKSCAGSSTPPARNAGFCAHVPEDLCAILRWNPHLQSSVSSLTILLSEFFSTPFPPFTFLLKFYLFDCIAPTIVVQTFSLKIEIFWAAYVYLGMWPSTDVWFTYQGLNCFSLTYHLSIASNFLARERRSLYPLSMLGFLLHLKFSRS